MTHLVRSLRTHLETTTLDVLARSDGEGLAHGELTAPELEKRILALISLMQRSKVAPGNRAVLALPSSLDILAAFWACLSMGVTAVPAPSLVGGRRQLDRLEHLARICAVAAPAALFCSTEDAVILSKHHLGATVLDPRDADDLVGIWPDAAPTPDSTAMLQFTSGSTGDPKGCVITHGHMFANATEIIRRTGAQCGDAVISWLPPHHDMGLMSGIVTPMVGGLSTRLMSPARFLANPVSWLRALDCGRPSHTAAPNFALGLVLQRIRCKLPALRLDHVRSITCGAEPINAMVARDFLTALEPLGLRREAFHAAYGMAEGTVMVTSQPGGLLTRRVSIHGAGPGSRVTEDMDAAACARPSLEVVTLGNVIDGGEVRIVDGEGKPMEEGRLGLVQFRSPSCMTGYFQNLGASAAAFDGSWLKTADLGFIIGGLLHVLGRNDDVIIIAGENFYPTDIEASVARRLDVEPLRVAAFGRRRADGTQDLCVALETRTRTAEETTRAVGDAVFAACGLFPTEILLLPPGALPRTTSGKIQRQHLQAMPGSWKGNG